MTVHVYSMPYSLDKAAYLDQPTMDGGVCVNQ